MGESCTALWERSSLLFAKSVIPPWPAVTLPWEESCLDRSACLWELPAAWPLSLSLLFSLFCSLHLPHTLFFPPSLYSSIYIFLSHRISPFAPPFLLSCLPPRSFVPFHFSVFYSKLYACFTQHQYFQDSLPPHPPSRFLPCEGAEALLSGDRSLFFCAPTEKINTQSLAIDSLQYGLQSRTTGTRERENEGRNWPLESIWHGLKPGLKLRRMRLRWGCLLIRKSIHVWEKLGTEMNRWIWNSMFIQSLMVCRSCTSLHRLLEIHAVLCKLRS